MPRRDTLESTASAQAPAPVPAEALGCAVRRLREAAGTAREHALALRRPVLAWSAATIPLADPVDILERAVVVAQDRFLWLREDDHSGLVGLGAGWAFAADGEERFPLIEHAWRSVLDEAVGRGPVGSGPVAFYGFSFASQRDRAAWPHWDGYPAGLVVIPRVLVSRTGDESRLTLTLVVEPGEPPRDPGYPDSLPEVYQALLTHVAGGGRTGSLAGEGSGAAEEFPSAEEWKASVRETARAVQNGDLRKAVLARGLRLRGRRFDPIEALRRLRDGYPGCTVFAVARGDRCFLGATPERLVGVRNGEVTAAAMAGSAPRGGTDEEDHERSRMLLASAKDRVEHAVVVEALREALADVCTEISAEDPPRLLTLRNVHHLYTPLRAILQARATVLSLTRRLHPTPAVAGVPREAALDWIRRHERWDRGWYAGPIGWIDQAGEGEAAIAIRSALVEPDDAFLFAGCGIVADSDPEHEYAESDLKLHPMLSALVGGRAPIGQPARQRKGQA